MQIYLIHEAVEEFGLVDDLRVGGPSRAVMR